MKSKQYHHGDLKTSIVNAALSSLKNVSIERLSLRSIAKLLGVSHAAAYHHFKNKEELLAAIAVDGFEKLQKRLEHEVTKSTDPITRLKLFMKSYVVFGIDYPESYRLMYSSKLREEDAVSAVQNAGQGVYQLILDLVEDIDKADLLKPHQPREVVTTLWSLGHGTISLILDGPLRNAQTNIAMRETILDNNIKHMFQGIMR